MGETTKIQWCDHTYNPWRGCSKVSAGCQKCYAEAMAKRNPSVMGEWGPNGRRAIAADSYWRLPARWNRAARKAGERRRVFCGSMMDVFEDRPELSGPREWLFNLIYECRELDWLLLTKRPDVAERFICGSSGAGWNCWREHYPHVWLGVSCEDQATADERIPVLLRTPAAVRFLSCEPLLGPIDLRHICHYTRGCDGYDAVYGWRTSYQYKARGPEECSIGVLARPNHRLDWVIVGGESGPSARPCRYTWITSIVEQCRAASVPCFVKQWGRYPVLDGVFEDEQLERIPNYRCRPDPDNGGFAVWLEHPKGGDPAEWPEDLRVREFLLSEPKEAKL